MHTDHSTTPTVLLADDEPGLLGLYEAWLADCCDVRTASDGEEALAAMDEEVDVALLDRRMPDMSGDEVLREIRNEGYDCQVGMLTAVQPEADIVDMPFDDYLTKPVKAGDVKSLVDVLLQRDSYDDKSQRLFALASKKAALETSPDIHHEDTDEYQELTERMAELRSELDTTLDELMEHDYATAFRAIEG